MVNSCFYQNRCLGGPKSSKSAILDGKQLFLLNQVFGRSRELQIGYFRWKTAVFIKTRCLGGSGTSKSAIIERKQLCLLTQPFITRSKEPKIGYFRWKRAVYIKWGVFMRGRVAVQSKQQGTKDKIILLNKLTSNYYYTLSIVM